MFGAWNVCDVGSLKIGMLTWDIHSVGCLGCGIFGMCDVSDAGRLGCEIFEMWDAWDVECLGCGMFGR